MSNEILPTNKLPRSWDELSALMEHIPDTMARYHRFGFQNNFYFDEYSSHVPKQVVLDKRKSQFVNSKSFVPNNFPYNRLLVHLPFVKHFILWSDTQLTTNEIQAYLSQVLGSIDFRFYENKPDQKSIPEIFHVQVFVNFDTSDTMLEFMDTHYPN